MEAEEAAEQLDLRMKRREKVDGPDPAHVTVLIFEPVLHLLVGSPEIMVA